MARSVRLRKFTRKGGRVYLTWGDKSELEFDGLADMRRWANSRDDRDADALRQMLIKWWVNQDPTAANEALVEGKTITIDLGVVPTITIL